MFMVQVKASQEVGAGPFFGFTCSKSFWGRRTGAGTALRARRPRASTRSCWVHSQPEHSEEMGSDAWGLHRAAGRCALRELPPDYFIL